jgi:hypothetical protein
MPPQSGGRPNRAPRPHSHERGPTVSDYINEIRTLGKEVKDKIIALKDGLPEGKEISDIDALHSNELDTAAIEIENITARAENVLRDPSPHEQERLLRISEANRDLRELLATFNAFYDVLKIAKEKYLQSPEAWLDEQAGALKKSLEYLERIKSTYPDAQIAAPDEYNALRDLLGNVERLLGVARDVPASLVHVKSVLQKYQQAVAGAFDKLGPAFSALNEKLHGLDDVDIVSQKQERSLSELEKKIKGYQDFCDDLEQAAKKIELDVAVELGNFRALRDAFVERYKELESLKSRPYVVPGTIEFAQQTVDDFKIKLENLLRALQVRVTEAANTKTGVSVRPSTLETGQVSEADFNSVNEAVTKILNEAVATTDVAQKRRLAGRAHVALDNVGTKILARRDQLAQVVADLEKKLPSEPALQAELAKARASFAEEVQRANKIISWRMTIASLTSLRDTAEQKQDLQKVKDLMNNLRENVPTLGTDGADLQRSLEWRKNLKIAHGEVARLLPLCQQAYFAALEAYEAKQAQKNIAYKVLDIEAAAKDELAKLEEAKMELDEVAALFDETSRLLTQNKLKNKAATRSDDVAAYLTKLADHQGHSEEAGRSGGSAVRNLPKMPTDLNKSFAVPDKLAASFGKKELPYAELMNSALAKKLVLDRLDQEDTVRATQYEAHGNKALKVAVALRDQAVVRLSKWYWRQSGLKKLGLGAIGTFAVIGLVPLAPAVVGMASAYTARGVVKGLFGGSLQKDKAALKDAEAAVRQTVAEQGAVSAYEQQRQLRVAVRKKKARLDTGKFAAGLVAGIASGGLARVYGPEEWMRPSISDLLRSQAFGTTPGGQLPTAITGEPIQPAVAPSAPSPSPVEIVGDPAESLIRGPEAVRGPQVEITANPQVASETPSPPAEASQEIPSSPALPAEAVPAPTEAWVEVRRGDALSRLLHQHMIEAHQAAQFAGVDPDTTPRELARLMYEKFPEMRAADGIRATTPVERWALSPAEWREVGVQSGNPNLIRPGERINMQRLLELAGWRNEQVPAPGIPVEPAEPLTSPTPRGSLEARMPQGAREEFIRQLGVGQEELQNTLRSSDAMAESLLTELNSPSQSPRVNEAVLDPSFNPESIPPLPAAPPPPPRVLTPPEVPLPPPPASLPPRVENLTGQLRVVDVGATGSIPITVIGDPVPEPGPVVNVNYEAVSAPPPDPMAPRVLSAADLRVDTFNAVVAEQFGGSEAFAAAFDQFCERVDQPRGFFARLIAPLTEINTRSLREVVGDQPLGEVLAMRAVPREEVQAFLTTNNIPVDNCQRWLTVAERLERDLIARGVSINREQVTFDQLVTLAVANRLPFPRTAVS